jgi:glutathione S-transferase
LDKNEHRSAAFRRMNPLHQVPTLDHDSFFLTDSHAIVSYLAANSNLLSNDRRLQARINQLLFFDFELFKIFCEIGVSWLCQLLCYSIPVMFQHFYRFHCF